MMRVEITGSSHLRTTQDGRDAQAGVIKTEYDAGPDFQYPEIFDLENGDGIRTTFGCCLRAATFCRGADTTGRAEQPVSTASHTANASPRPDCGDCVGVRYYPQRKNGEMKHFVNHRQ